MMMLPLVILLGFTSAVAVPDAEMASIRGGVDLPNGLSVSLGVDVRVLVDGALAGTASYLSDGSTKGLQIAGSGDVAGLQISSMAGERTGVIVANQTDGRSIDVGTTLNVALKGLNAAQFNAAMTVLPAATRALVTR